jgi:hypothetical protein
MNINNQHRPRFSSDSSDGLAAGGGVVLKGSEMAIRQDSRPVTITLTARQLDLLAIMAERELLRYSRKREEVEANPVDEHHPNYIENVKRWEDERAELAILLEDEVDKLERGVTK